MTAQQATVWELRCDVCDAVAEDEEYGSTLVADSAERIREIGESQQWSREGDSDFCPSCTCVRVGHDRAVSGSGAFAYCLRCSETLIEDAQPKAAYL